MAKTGAWTWEGPLASIRNCVGLLIKVQSQWLKHKGIFSCIKVHSPRAGATAPQSLGSLSLSLCQLQILLTTQNSYWGATHYI